MIDEHRTTYLRQLLQRYGVFGLPLGTGLHFSLVQVYQPLRLRQRARTDEQQVRPEGNAIQETAGEDRRE